MGVDKPKVTTKNKGKWVVSESTSPIDDSVTVTMMLDASDTILNPYGQFTRPTLILRCSENKTNAFINWNMFLGTDTIRVLNRIDKQKAKTRSWYISTDNKAIFAPKDIAFIKSLFGHEKLLQQLTPYSESPKTASFKIGGLQEAIKPLRKACRW
jgi:type VI secretion system protein VasI